MEARELRIGNNIEYFVFSNDDWQNNPDGKWEILKVDGDYISYIETEPNHYCRPIPLTEEWLLKFGFYEINKVSKSFGIQVSKKQFIFVKLKEVGNNPRWKISHEFNTEEIYLFREVEFVHDLQNIFFELTGKELRLDRATR